MILVKIRFSLYISLWRLYINRVANASVLAKKNVNVSEGCNITKNLQSVRTEM